MTLDGESRRSNSSSQVSLHVLCHFKYLVLYRLAGRRSKAITTIEHWVRKGEKSLSDFRQHAVELLFVPATFIVLSVLYEAMGLLPIF